MRISMRSDPLPYGQRGRDRNRILIYEVYKNVQYSFAGIRYQIPRHRRIDTCSDRSSSTLQT